MQSPRLGAVERRELVAVVLAEVERLARHFQNILDMARIEAHGIASVPRWVCPEEILDAAQHQAASAFRIFVPAETSPIAGQVSA